MVASICSLFFSHFFLHIQIVIGILVCVHSPGFFLRFHSNFGEFVSFLLVYITFLFHSHHYRSLVLFNICFVSVFLFVPHLVFRVIPPSPSHVLHHQMSISSSTYFLTASSLFASLDTIPLAFFITRPRSRMSYTHNILVSVLILLFGDTQSNSGPTSNG